MRAEDFDVDNAFAWIPFYLDISGLRIDDKIRIFIPGKLSRYPLLR